MGPSSPPQKGDAAPNFRPMSIVAKWLHGSRCHIRNFPSVSGVNIAGTLVPISDKIVTLGVTLDHYLALSHHTSNVCRAAYFHIGLRALRHIKPSLTEDMAITVAVSMVCVRLRKLSCSWSHKRSKTAVCTEFCC